MERTTHSTGTPWEQAVAYSRAVRVGPHVYFSGTTASNVDGSAVAIGDAYGQTVFILRKIEAAFIGDFNSCATALLAYIRHGEKTLASCPACGRPLRTNLAKQCFDCGEDWHSRI